VFNTYEQVLELSINKAVLRSLQSYSWFQTVVLRASEKSSHFERWPFTWNPQRRLICLGLLLLLSLLIKLSRESTAEEFSNSQKQSLRGNSEILPTGITRTQGDFVQRITQTSNLPATQNAQLLLHACIMTFLYFSWVQYFHLAQARQRGSRSIHLSSSNNRENLFVIKSYVDSCRLLAYCSSRQNKEERRGQGF